VKCWEVDKFQSNSPGRLNNSTGLHRSQSNMRPTDSRRHIL